MQFEPDEAQRALVEMARQFAAERMAPHAARWDEEKTFPVDMLRHAATLGFAGLICDPARGGAGLSRLDGVLLFEELAAADPSTAAYLSIHNMVVGMIDRHGDDAQRACFLPRLLTMEWFGSYCLTEPGHGSDAGNLTTRAVREGDAYVLDGAKSFISGAGVSDLYLVMARTGGEGPAFAGSRGISCFAVERDRAGLSFGAPEKKLGWNSQPTASLAFESCRVPVANRIGGEGEGFAIAMRALDGGRLNIAACSLGGARTALTLALAYVAERRQFGQRIADFQATQFRLADMATNLDAARLLLHRAAASLDAGHVDATMRCAMAKRFATDHGWQIVDEALQLFGGYGYIKEVGIERFLRDLRVHRILEGTNEIMRVIIARRMLDTGWSPTGSA